MTNPSPTETALTRDETAPSVVVLVPPLHPTVRAGQVRRYGARWSSEYWADYLITSVNVAQGCVYCGPYQYTLSDVETWPLVSEPASHWVDWPRLVSAEVVQSAKEQP